MKLLNWLLERFGWSLRPVYRCHCPDADCECLGMMRKGYYVPNAALDGEPPARMKGHEK